MKTTSLKTKLSAVMLTLCLALSLVPVTVFAANTAVTDETELINALENADCTEIKLSKSVETSSTLKVERTVTLDLNGYTVSCSSADTDIIRVRSNGSLTIKDSGTDGAVDGQNKNCGISVNGGTFTLESGNIINCTEKKINGGGDGGAVDLSSSITTEGTTKYGKFIMNGGAIKNCTAGDDGGAVDIGDAGCTFIMNGGIIENCRAANRGGAVHIRENALFVMNGGAIQNCSAANKGGAVNIYQNGRFTMNGGTIKSCKVDLGGIGYAVYGSNDMAVVALIGGTFEDCGVFPYSFDEFTVTFDCDGGSAITEQKLCNSPAVKPADPQKDGYTFNGWYLDNTKYMFDTNVASNITLKAKWTPAATSNSIASVDVENVKLNYQPGENPQPTARLAGTNMDKYDIRYESWEKRVKDANDTISTVAYWYSFEDCYSDGDVRFDTFEKGGRYQYSIRLSAKDGYTFDSNLNNENVTLNGRSLPFGSWVNVLDDGKTCLITYGTDTRPGQVVESIRLDAVIDFTAGDTPRFSTGIVDPIVDTDHQRWDADDGSGYGITTSEFWNTRYNGKLITAFEYGKSYTYGVYFKISDLGLEEGYRFDKNTKLYINGKEITLTPDQINLDDNGETVWFSNVLTMTPTPAKTWQKIDVIEVEGATVKFKDGDKPVFTGKTPKNAPYIYQFECWETKDGAGVNSAEFFDNAYEKHITAFKSGENYQYILYFKAKDGYYFTADTKIKVNGTFHNFRLVNIDPDHDSSGRMYTFWAYTNLIMTPQSGSEPHNHSYGTTWKYNETNHWHECACGNKADITAHTFKWVTDKEASKTENGLKHEECTVCGYKKNSVDIPASGSNTGSNGNAGNTGNTNNTGYTASPKTGSNTNLTLWFTVLILSGGALTVLLIKSKRETNHCQTAPQVLNKLIAK